MNVQYQRNLKNSYMVIVEQGQPLNLDGQLAEKMLLHQEIPGLLRWVTMENQGDMTFWYQITGLQSLSDWLGYHPLDMKLLQHLLAGLLSLQSELPRFYLKCEHLLLHPEQIFLDAAGEGVTFCYEPLWQQEPQQSLRELLEQLLPQVDHKDKGAVGLTYGLYELCQQENADVWGYVLAHGVNGAPVELSEQPKQGADSQKGPSDSPEKAVRAMAFAEEKPNLSKSEKPEYRENPPREEKPAWIEKKSQRMPVVSALSWVQSLGIGKKKKEERPEALYLFEPEDEPAASGQPTVCLAAVDHAEGRLVYQGNGTEESFVIEGESFLVGGRNGQADARLQSSWVSRNHARITREENDYYIEDLNSKNGTYLNGDLLPYRQRRPMKPGDHLRFAREEYVFY
jgi:hypothetical protein